MEIERLKQTLAFIIAFGCAKIIGFSTFYMAMQHIRSLLEISAASLQIVFGLKHTTLSANESKEQLALVVSIVQNLPY